MPAESGINDSGSGQALGLPSLPGLANRFYERMRSVILPFWVSKAFLGDAGQFSELIDFDGNSICEVPLRAMVQARQIYVYTDAERTGELKGGGERALRALEILLSRYSEDGDLTKGLAFSVSPDGHIVSHVRDSYTHAFLLFALASAYRLTNETRLLRAANFLVTFIDGRLTDSISGGLFDRVPEPSAFKLQNPLMHLLEAYLALHEACPGRGFIDRAASIVRLFGEQLFQHELGIVFEKYGADWSVTGLGPASSFEPGHQFEWAWLLDRYGSLTGNKNERLSDRLWSTACKKGLSHDFHCSDEIAIDPAFSKHTLRVWPHTEGMKAAVRRYEHGDKDAGKILAGLLHALNLRFLGRPFQAGWIDRVDIDGNQFRRRSQPVHSIICTRPLKRFPKLALILTMRRDYRRRDA